MIQNHIKRRSTRIRNQNSPYPLDRKDRFDFKAGLELTSPPADKVPVAVGESDADDDFGSECSLHRSPLISLAMLSTLTPSYQRFMDGRLIYKPSGDSEAIEFSFRDYLLDDENFEGEFPLNQCEDAGNYLSISLGYKKEKIVSHENKMEIFIVPKYVVEADVSTTATQYQNLMSLWPADAPFGIFFTWGDWENLFWYNYVVSVGYDEIENYNLLDLRMMVQVYRTPCHYFNKAKVYCGVPSTTKEKIKSILKQFSFRF
jgi:hypothetical protein